MKAELKFDLPEEQEEFNMYLKSTDMYCLLFNMQNELRNFQKHGVSNYGKNEKEILETIYTQIWEILE